MGSPKKADEVHPDLNFLLIVLKACPAIQPDWNQVANEVGIAYARNASTRFQTTLKRYGYKAEGGQVMEIAAAAGAASATSKAPITSKKASKVDSGDDAGSAGKKRKLGKVLKTDDNDEEEGDEIGSDASHDAAAEEDRD